MQQAPLRSVGKPLIYGQIAGEHNAHQMTVVQDLLRFKGAVEISSEMQEPTALHTNLAADETDSFVGIPVLTSSAPSAHFRLTPIPPPRSIHLFAMSLSTHTSNHARQSRKHNTGRTCTRREGKP